MAEEEKANLRLEIAHVLFMDIVGYSKLLIDEQREALHELNNLVLNTDAVREAEAAGSLIRLPTGDGMALAFTSSMEAPAECALQIGQALRAQPSLPLRMGIHSGSVQHVTDVNGRENIAGSGINIAQRVMDCGDAGHILVSKRVADDLAGSRRWAPLLHELGECEVKHGLVVSMVNLYADVVGNPARPAKFGGVEASRSQVGPAGDARPGVSRWLLGAGALLVVAAAVAFVLWQKGDSGQRVRPASAPPAATLAAPDKSVAVLPFENLSTDKDNAFFADGVQDEVLTDLSKVADLKVISRTSVMQFKDPGSRNLPEIGKALGVAFVVEGSVQRAGNKIRVVAQLIDARTDTHRWAEHYDRDLADVFAIQSEIAQSIAGQLQAAISPQAHDSMMEAPTHDIQAYELYLKARERWNDNNESDLHARLDQVIPLLKDATRRDPNFTQALAFEADIEASFYQNVEPTATREATVRSLAETVARLRPGSFNAHMAMGAYQHFVRRDFARSREEYAAAVQLAPNSGEALLSLAGADCRLGRWDEAPDLFRRASELDPESVDIAETYTYDLREMGRYQEALDVVDHALATHPQWLFLHYTKCSVLMAWKADTRAARAELALMPGVDPGGYATGARLSCDYWERDFAAAERDLAACPLAEIDGQPRASYRASNARYRGDAAAAAAGFGEARTASEAKVRAQPANADALMGLAWIDACLGRKQEARDEARRAAAIHPPEQDARVGPELQAALAQVLASTGDREEAIRILQRFCGKPAGPPYGWLKADPDWDPLRGDPRFQALVASLEPNPVSK